MKNLKTLSKIEMKNVIDGLIDKDTTLEYCIEPNYTRTYRQFL